MRRPGNIHNPLLGLHTRQDCHRGSRFQPCSPLCYSILVEMCSWQAASHEIRDEGDLLKVLQPVDVHLSILPTPMQICKSFLNFSSTAGLRFGMFLAHTAALYLNMGHAMSHLWGIHSAAAGPSHSAVWPSPEGSLR